MVSFVKCALLGELVFFTHCTLVFIPKNILFLRSFIMSWKESKKLLFILEEKDNYIYSQFTFTLSIVTIILKDMMSLDLK